jgi:hypothetical protein
MHGITRGFEFGIDLVFDIGKRERRNVLNLAVIVRRSSELPSQTPQPSYLQPPPGSTSGGGASVGPFSVQFWLPQRELYVNGIRLFTVPADVNVLMLDELNGSLVVAGTEQLALDFESDTAPLRSADPSPVAVWTELLRRAFSQSPRVQAFLESSAHPAFDPILTSKGIRGRDFAPGVDSWYCITAAQPKTGAQLDCVVLVKLSDASREVIAEPVWRQAPPFGSGPALGTSFGPHAIVYQVEGGVLWVDGLPQAKPSDAQAHANVYIFRERGGSLELVGAIAIDRDPRAPWRTSVMDSAEFRRLLA